MENSMALFIITIFVFQFVFLGFCMYFIKEIDELNSKVEDIKKHEDCKIILNTFSPMEILRLIMNRYH